MPSMCALLAGGGATAIAMRDASGAQALATELYLEAPVVGRDVVVAVKNKPKYMK